MDTAFYTNGISSYNEALQNYSNKLNEDAVSEEKLQKALDAPIDDFNQKLSEITEPLGTSILHEPVGKLIKKGANKFLEKQVRPRLRKFLGQTGDQRPTPDAPTPPDGTQVRPTIEQIDDGEARAISNATGRSIANSQSPQGTVSEPGRADIGDAGDGVRDMTAGSTAENRTAIQGAIDNTGPSDPFSFDDIRQDQKTLRRYLKTLPDRDAIQAAGEADPRYIENANLADQQATNLRIGAEQLKGRAGLPDDVAEVVNRLTAQPSNPAEQANSVLSAPQAEAPQAAAPAVSDANGAAATRTAGTAPEDHINTTTDEQVAARQAPKPRAPGRALADGTTDVESGLATAAEDAEIAGGGPEDPFSDIVAGILGIGSVLAGAFGQKEEPRASLGSAEYIPSTQFGI
jgi:hypothetical protein